MIMKGNRLTLRGLVLMAFLAICSIAAAQVPTGFPTMPNTGNPGADAEAYEQAKQAWIANNPSSPVNSSPVVTPQPTVQDNEAYEANKLQQAQIAGGTRQAAKQLASMEEVFRANHEDWSANNPRLHEAYMEAFRMARGQTVVTVTAQQYASFHQELRSLIDANPSLFVVTQ
jgi:hypothetical protein